jgi:hypothetical protein
LLKILRLKGEKVHIFVTRVFLEDMIADMKLWFVFAATIFMPFGFMSHVASQTENLKTLFNPLEDYASEAVGARKFTYDTDSVEARSLGALLKTPLMNFVKSRSLFCEMGFHRLVIDGISFGSYTSVGTKQRAISYRFCEPLEYYENDGPQFGIAVLEGKQLIANFINFSKSTAMYSVSDVNRNGLNELMLEIPSSKSKGSAVQLLELPNAQPVEMGVIDIGGPGSTPVPIGRLCGDAPLNPLPTEFQSNVIYVTKRVNPQFYRQAYAVKVTCLNKEISGRAKVVWKQLGVRSQISPQKQGMQLIRTYPRS